ncbi:MAG: hypothetical protein ABIF71_01100 [Planctomycetota bacterium]
MIKHKNVAEAWRLVFQTGRYTQDYVYGSGQKPARIEVTQKSGTEAIHLHYKRVKGETIYPIECRFTLALEADSPELKASVEIANKGACEIQEVEFPLINGITTQRNITKCMPGGQRLAAFYSILMIGAHSELAL